MEYCIYGPFKIRSLLCTNSAAVSNTSLLHSKACSHRPEEALDAGGDPVPVYHVPPLTPAPGGPPPPGLHPLGQDTLVNISGTAAVFLICSNSHCALCMMSHLGFSLNLHYTIVDNMNHNVH